MVKRIILMLLLLYIVLVTSCSYIKYDASTGLLKNLEAGDYEAAFEYLHYYNDFDGEVVVEVEPETSYAEAKKIWTERVKEFKEEGIYISAFNDLNVIIDDGCPVGRVKLTITDREDIIECDGLIHLAKFHGEWKVAYIYITPVDLNIENPNIIRLMMALCGSMP